MRINVNVDVGHQFLETFEWEEDKRGNICSQRFHQAALTNMDNVFTFFYEMFAFLYIFSNVNFFSYFHLTFINIFY